MTAFTRRRFLSGAAVAGTSALLPSAAATQSGKLPGADISNANLTRAAVAKVK